MNDETHSNNLEEALNNENVGENDAPTFDETIVLENVRIILKYSVTVVCASHEHRVEENHQDDKVIEPWAKGQPDNCSPDKVFGIKDEQGSAIVNNKLLIYMAFKPIEFHVEM